MRAVGTLMAQYGVGAEASWPAWSCFGMAGMVVFRGFSAQTQRVMIRSGDRSLVVKVRIRQWWRVSPWRGWQYLWI